MNEELQRMRRLCYAKGYNAGRQGRWPDYEPLPDDAKIRALAEAARDLSNSVDAMFAVTYDDAERDLDPFGIERNRERVHAALCTLSQFTTPLTPAPR